MCSPLIVGAISLRYGRSWIVEICLIIVWASPRTDGWQVFNVFLAFYKQYISVFIVVCMGKGCGRSFAVSWLMGGHKLLLPETSCLTVYLYQSKKMDGKLVGLPMELLMGSSFNNSKELAFKTIPSASKVEIRRVLESMWGFQVEKVRTLNMQGKKKRRGSRLVAAPNYKKAYVTMKNPLTISDLYHIMRKDSEVSSTQ